MMVEKGFYVMLLYVLHQHSDGVDFVTRMEKMLFLNGEWKSCEGPKNHVFPKYKN